MPEVLVAPSAVCADLVADLVVDLVATARPNPGDESVPCIGLATGRSVKDLHSRLVALHRGGTVDLNRARWIMLDEILDIGAGDPRSFRTHLLDELVSTFDPTGSSLIGPRLELGDPSAICEDFRLAASSVTPALQILGIGRNGHVGFNEPGSSADSRVRIVDLAETTVADLDPRDWPGQPRPHRAITRGIADIAAAGTIVLFAFGSAKAPAVKAALGGPISTDCPASFLRDHRDFRVFLDDEAASLL